MSPAIAISVAELRESAARIRLLRQKATEHAIDIGRELLRIKASLPHGAFVKWVQKECEFKIRTAQDLMKLARAADVDGRPVALLMPSTLRLFMSKNTPESVRRLVLEKLEKGERVSRSALKSAIRQAKSADTTKQKQPLPQRRKPDTAFNGLIAMPDAARETESDRAKKIAQLFVERLTEQDYAYVMSEISWGVWNRVLVWLRALGTTGEFGRGEPARQIAGEPAGPELQLSCSPERV